MFKAAQASVSLSRQKENSVIRFMQIGKRDTTGPPDG